MMKLFRVAGFATTAFQNFRSKMVAANNDGQPLTKRIGGVIQVMRELKAEAASLKRVEILKDIAKGDKQRQIAALKQRMSQLNLKTVEGKKESDLLKRKIDALNGAYKSLTNTLDKNAQSARNWSANVQKSAAAATFGLDKYAKTQDRVARFGRIGGRIGAGALALGGAASAIQTGGGGAGAIISAAGAGLSFLPGAGMLLGIGTSIVGSIVSGFEQANQEKEAEKEQKRIEIKAKIAEIQAEKVNNVSTIAGTLIGMGKDPGDATLSTNAIVSAATKAIRKVVIAPSTTGFTAESASASLIQSEKLQSFITSSKTRGVILQAAAVAAQSKRFNVTDTATGTVTIDPDSITSFLENTVGDKTGQAAIDAVNAYIAKNKNTIIDILPDGTARTITTGQQTQQNFMEQAKINNPAIIKAINDGLTSVASDSFGGLFGGGVTQELADALNTTVDRLNNTDKLTIQEMGDAVIRRLEAEMSGKLGPVVSTQATGKPSSAEMQFRQAMANIGKPKKVPDPLPTPTTSFYKNSVTNGQTQIGLLNDIKTALTTTTKQTIELKDKDGKVVSTYEVTNGVVG
jgi:hypothetical protein